MKKVLVVLLALVLCVQCVPALAGLGEYVSFSDLYHFDSDAYTQMQDEENTQSYTHATLGYSLTLPQEWILVDKTNLTSQLTACRQGEISVPGVDVATLISNASAQIASLDYVLVLDEQANYMAIAATNVGQVISNEDLIASINYQYAAQLPSARVLRAGDLKTFGNKEFIVFELEVPAGTATYRIMQYVLHEGTWLYTLTCNTLPICSDDQVNAFITNVEYICGTLQTTK